MCHRLVRVLGAMCERVSDVPLESPGIATFINPHSYLRLRRRRDLLASMERVYVDGIAMVAAMRLIGIKVQRRSMDMTSMAPGVLTNAVEAGLSVAVIGGRPGVAERALLILQRRLGELNLVCVHHGYFPTTAAREAVLEAIQASRPQLVIVGMGAPHQEDLLVSLKDRGWRGVGYTCGGFLHQTAGTRDGTYYPGVVQRFNLRWIFRLIDEPRLVRRYFLMYPWFVLIFSADVVKERLVCIPKLRVGTLR